MNSYVVSAIKYRPTNWDSVVGQKGIVMTLQNAIKNNHLGKAFLFCGPRGVGKTTIARILANTINRQDDTNENTNFSFNVFELDAASNNSVDDIRNLIDKVRIAPQVGKYKVYIIDEVHMLSNAAFNAFLKTLEEPPSYAIFILATTEKHKILPTIISRCQVFSFSRIQTKDIVEHLKKIAEKEGVKYEDDALHLISQKSDGGLRDALSIFDQIVSFSNNNVSYENVIQNLNILDYDYYFSVTNSLIENNHSQSLLIFNEIVQKGFDGHQFILGLAEHIRNLLVCKDIKTLTLLDIGKLIAEKYKEQSEKCDKFFLLDMLEILSQCDINYKQSKNQHLLIEITLMQLASITLDETKKKN